MAFHLRSHPVKVIFNKQVLNQEGNLQKLLELLNACICINKSFQASVNRYLMCLVEYLDAAYFVKAPLY